MKKDEAATVSARINDGFEESEVVLHLNYRKPGNPEEEDVTNCGKDDCLDRKADPVKDYQSSIFCCDRLNKFLSKHSHWIGRVRTIALLIGYFAYLSAATYIQLGKSSEIDWCRGVGFLIVATVIFSVGILYFQVKKWRCFQSSSRRCSKILGRKLNIISRWRFFPYAVVLVVVAVIITYLVIDTAGQRERLRSGLGVVVLILLGFAFSKHPRKVRWRHVCWGLGLQFVFGLLALRWPTGKNALECFGEKVSRFLDFSNVGASFVYNHLVDGQPITAEILSSDADFNATVILKPGEIGSVFAFKVLSVVFFFNFFVQILYYYGVMQWIVMKLGWLLSVTIGTTAAESMSTAANIFLAQTEAPLVIKPFLPIMTHSELHAVMSGGFATVAGSVLAAYISYGIEATHLIAASVMAAPASLAFAKLLYPETELSKTTTKDIKMEKATESNALDAAAQGASSAVMVVLNICASLVAFLSFIAFVNSVFAWLFHLIDLEGITFVWIITKVLIPLAWCLGVDTSECEMVAELIATKNVVNEFAGFSKLGQWKRNNLISPRAEGIATFAMCGFANPGSIGIQLAVIATMAPSRKGDLAQVAFRAFLSGTATSILNACVAGSFENAELKMADVKNQNIQPSPVSVTYSMGSMPNLVPNQNQQQPGLQPNDQNQQQMQQQGMQQSIQVQQQPQQQPQFVFQQNSVSAQGQLGSSGSGPITTMANMGTMASINMANMGLQHALGGQSNQSIQHSNMSSTPMPQLQVIQQPMGGGSYIQQLYNTQGQPILMPGSVLQHSVNQPIQVIAAGKPFQGGQIGGSHMIAGKQILQTGQAVTDWNQFRNATYIPTSGQGQTLVISQLGQLGAMLNPSQQNLIANNQNQGKPGEQKPYLHVVNNINQKAPILPASVSNGVGVSVGVANQMKGASPGGASVMTSQSQIITTQGQTNMLGGQPQMISQLQYLPQQFNLGQGFTWATGPNGMQQPILSHNPPIYIRSGAQPDGSGGMIFAAQQQQIQTHQQGVTQLGQMNVSQPVRTRQPGEVSVVPAIQPKVAPRPITSAPPQIRPAPASSVSTQTLTGQSGTVKSKVRKMAAQKAAQQNAAKQNLENAVRAGLIQPVVQHQGQLQFVNSQGQIQPYQVQQQLQGNMVHFNPQMPMQFQIVGTPQGHTVTSQAHTPMPQVQIMQPQQQQIQNPPTPQPLNQPVQSTTSHNPSPSQLSERSVQSPRPYQAAPSPRPYQAAQSPRPYQTMMSSPHPSQSPHQSMQSPGLQQHHQQQPQTSQGMQIIQMPSLMSPPLAVSRPAPTPQAPISRHVQTPPASAPPQSASERPRSVAQGPSSGTASEPGREAETVTPSPLQQIQMQVQQQFSAMPQMPPAPTSTRFGTPTNILLPTTTTTAPSQMIVPSVSFGASTVTVASRTYRPIAPAPMPGSQPMTAVPFGNLPPSAPPISFPPPLHDMPALMPQLSMPSVPQLTIPFVAGPVVSNSTSNMVTIPSSALMGAPISMPSLEPVPMDISPEKKAVSPRKVMPKLPEVTKDANQNLAEVNSFVPEVKKETAIDGLLKSESTRPSTPNTSDDVTPESGVTGNRAPILTHVIGDFLIQESSEPFPMVRLFPPSPGKARGKHRADDGPPRKKVALDSEMATCESCGTVDLAAKFKKNKTYCSSACAKKSNQLKTPTISLPANQDQQPMNGVQNGIAGLNPISPSTPTHPPVISVPNISPLKATDEMSDKDLDAELVMLAAQQNIQVVEGTASSSPAAKADPCKWTAKDVADFVRTLPGCDEYADEFLVQEIDGQALMLLKADHLMSAMNMKLGPALKICAKIESMRADANR